MAWGLVVAFVAAGVLAMLAWRSRAESQRLRERLRATLGRLESLQHDFSTFAPRELVERIVSRGLTTTGERKEVTILFADLVDFTGLSERLGPDVVVGMLNGYFERMSRIVAEHRGHVAKFIGDGMLALFGALEPNPWQANDAAHAALAMREALARYNEDLTARGLPVLRAGIGIHRGDVVAGVLGSHELMEFTVIGDSVNVAARVERLTRENGADILVTSQVRERLDPRFVVRELPATMVKGRTEPVATFEVRGVGD